MAAALSRRRLISPPLYLPPLYLPPALSPPPLTCRRLISPPLSKHRCQWSLPFQHTVHVGHRNRRHLAARFLGRTADVRQQHGARCGDEPRMDRGLLRVNVQPRGTQAPLFQRLRQRLLANQVAAGRVDEDRARLHLRQRLAVDDPLGLRARRHVQAQDVALGEEPLEIDARRAGLGLERGLRAAGRIENPQPKRERAAADRLADAPGAEEAEHFALQLETEELLGMPARPLAATHEIDAFAEAARRRENQRPREIGGGFREHAGRVCDQHAAHLGGDEIDVVVADGAVRDDAELREILELAAADPTREQRHDRDPLAAGRWLLGRKPGDVETAQLRRIEQVLQLGGDQDGVGYRKTPKERMKHHSAIEKKTMMNPSAATLGRFWKNHKKPTTSTSAAVHLSRANTIALKAPSSVNSTAPNRQTP